MSNLNVAIILSGCGHLDGAEISEVVLTLLALEKRKVSYQSFAPNMDQFHVINHITGNITSEKRNVLVESARILRGKVKSIEECNSSNFDALIIPGGLGVAKNLSNFAFEKNSFQLQSDVLKVCQDFIGKPVGYICIAPALLPIIYGKNINLTIGKDKNTRNILKNLGAIINNCDFDDVVIDFENKIVSTPAYMLAKNVNEAYQGIDKLVEKMLFLLNKR